jgi:hypothetical protein
MPILGWVFFPLLKLDGEKGLVHPAERPRQIRSSFGILTMLTTKTKNCVLGCIVALAAVVAAEPLVAIAQRGGSPAERRLRPGAGYWENQRAARSMQHARDYSHGLYDYTVRSEQIAPPIAKAEAEGVARNLQASQRELTAVRQSAPDEQAIRTSLDKIDQHLKKATELHQKLHEECNRQDIDRAATAVCCDELSAELDQAIAEHASLMRRLERTGRSEAGPPIR